MCVACRADFKEDFGPHLDHPVFGKVMTKVEIRKDILIRVRKMMHSRKCNRIRDNREARGEEEPPKKKHKARAAPTTYVDMVRALGVRFHVL
jgi:hypothetical protein